MQEQTVKKITLDDRTQWKCSFNSVQIFISLNPQRKKAGSSNLTVFDSAQKPKFYCTCICRNCCAATVGISKTGLTLQYSTWSQLEAFSNTHVSAESNDNDATR
jgi:hypothetical protein